MRGNEKKSIFLNDEDRQQFLNILWFKKKQLNFLVLAYCLMDNHVHLLLNVNEQPVARVMKCINVSYALFFNRKYKRVGHLFQDRFKSENIDTDSYLFSALRYIHYNPVKAGMAKEIGEYPWSSYGEYCITKVHCRLVDTDIILGMYSNIRNKAIRRFIENSAGTCEPSFIDIEEDTEVKTDLEIREFVEQNISTRGLTYENVMQQKGNVKGTVKHELVLALKSNYKLGSREIAAHLGMSKSTVNNLLKE